MSAVLVTLAAAALIFFVLMSITVLNAVLRLRMQRPETMTLQSQEVPNDARKLLAPGLAQLLELGFAHPAPLRLFCMRVAGERVPQHALVLVHSKLPAAGYVMQLSLPDRGRHYGIYFVSRTQAGHTLVTRNRSSIAGAMPLPGFTTQDCWLPTWADVWRAHRRKMKALQPDPAQWQRLSAAEWLQAGAQAETEAFDHRIDRGHLIDAGDGTWRSSLGRALLTVGRAWAAWPRASRGMEGDKVVARVAPAGMPGSGPPPAAGTADAEGVARLVQSYERESLQRHTSTWSNSVKWLVFFITAVLGAGSFGLSMGWDVLPALLGVLLFHELGHFAAMRWAGYRDLKVFFLPFLGAAVSGRHESASAKQELIVLFAGPVPGLVLGLAGLLWLPSDLPGGDWWRSCAALAVTINAFNLLPIHPLDGGKIFEILLLGRWPWAAFAGRVLGLVGLGYLVMTMDSAIAQAVVGAMLLLMTLGLAHQLREAQLAATLRSAGHQGGLGRGEALQALFSAMGRIGLLKRPWPDLRLMTDALLPTLIRPRLRRRERAGGLAVYAFFLVLPVLALVFGMWSAAQRSAQREPGARASESAVPTQGAGSSPGLHTQMDQLFAGVKQRVLAEPDAGRRWALLVSDFAPMLDGMPAEEAARIPAALALLQEAQRLAPTLPDPVAKQARAGLWQAQFLADEVERRQVLASVMERYDHPAAAGADPGPLAEAAVDWLYERSGDAASRMAVIDKVMALLQARGSVERLAQLQEFKLDILLSRGDVNSARQHAAQWLAAASGQPGSEAHLHTAQQWADVLLLTEGPAAALQAVDQVLQPLDAQAAKQRNFHLDSLRRSGLWLAEATGRTDWQRRQVQRLQMASDAEAALPWWIKLISWGLSSGRPAPATLPQLEHAHWRGDAAEAGKLAASVCRRPGIASRLSVDTGAEQSLAAARLKLVNSGRRAICERYGVPVAGRP